MGTVTALNQSPQTRTSMEVPLTLARVEATLMEHPDDPLLLYVALQLARRAGRLADVKKAWTVARRGRPLPDPDALSLFCGAMAVLENLQLETLSMADPQTEGRPLLAASVDVETLSGPAVQSHPFTEMAEGLDVTVDELFAHIPADQWAAGFSSLASLREALTHVERWMPELGARLGGLGGAGLENALERVLEQLGLDDDTLLSADGGAVALTGNDLFFREGSDVTLLLDMRTAPHLADALERAGEQLADRSDVRPRIGACDGVPYLGLVSNDARLSVWTARPEAHLAVISTSEKALARVLRAGGETPALGRTDELRVIRNMLPAHGEGPEADELGFIYLSDPFIRRLTGPRIKLIERRRVTCLALQHMLEHAAVLFEAEQGRPPSSLLELFEKDAAPGVFGVGRLSCPDGGALSLDGDGHARCSCHGSRARPRPCVELELERVTEEEVRAYVKYVREYEFMWATYFDPIGVQLSSTADRLVIETIVLPLIENTVYRGLQMGIGGATPVPHAGARPDGSTFELSLCIDKDELLNHVPRGIEEPYLAQARRRMKSAGDIVLPDIRQFIERGLGETYSVFVLDSEPLFDFDVTGFFGLLLGGGGHLKTLGLGALAVTSLNAPVAVRFQTQDNDVADRFCAELEDLFALMVRNAGGKTRLGDVRYSFSHFDDVLCGTVASLSIEWLSFRWRLFWTRTDDAIWLTTRRSALHLVRADTTTPSAPSQAQLRLEPSNWERSRPAVLLAAAEREREQCFAAMGDAAARACVLGTDAAKRALATCPAGGEHHIGTDGSIACTLHGRPRRPTTPTAPAVDGAWERSVGQLSTLTAGLTLKGDGLRARVELVHPGTTDGRQTLG